MRLFDLIGLAMRYGPLAKEAEPLASDVALHIRYIRWKHAAVIGKIEDAVKGAQSAPLTPQEKKSVEDAIDDFRQQPTG